MLFTSYLMFIATIGLLVVTATYGYKTRDDVVLALCALATATVCFSVAGIVPDKAAVGAVVMPAAVQLVKMGGYYPVEESHDTA